MIINSNEIIFIECLSLFHSSFFFAINEEHYMVIVLMPGKILKDVACRLACHLFLFFFFFFFFGMKHFRLEDRGLSSRKRV